MLLFADTGEGRKVLTKVYTQVDRIFRALCWPLKLGIANCSSFPRETVVASREFLSIYWKTKDFLWVGHLLLGY